ncbi:MULTISPECIES: helix-turn-helix domain-containing protein [Amycolatopsis]|uniref:winged helix-turn-helix transcriptional regulator n=1 Tax=Amycolatopsis TaxID=1813 RepID=UPI000BA3EED5|nr:MULTISPECIES: winged helix-turn-helix transcriptional regulator [Amycolatopsis]
MAIEFTIRLCRKRAGTRRLIRSTGRKWRVRWNERWTSWPTGRRGLFCARFFYGTNRFLKLVEKTGLSTPVVADRLRRMTATGLVRKVAYQDPGRRARESYVFERPGLELMPALFALTQWGDRYLSDAGGPVAPVHAGCGSAIWVVPMCDDGHVVEPDEIGVALSRMFEPEVVSRPG